MGCWHQGNQRASWTATVLGRPILCAVQIGSVWVPTGGGDGGHFRADHPTGSSGDGHYPAQSAPDYDGARRATAARPAGRQLPWWGSPISCNPSCPTSLRRSHCTTTVSSTRDSYPGLLLCCCAVAIALRCCCCCRVVLLLLRCAVAVALCCCCCCCAKSIAVALPRRPPSSLADVPRRASAGPAVPRTPGHQAAGEGPRRRLRD